MTVKLSVTLASKPVQYNALYCIKDYQRMLTIRAVRRDSLQLDTGSSRLACWILPLALGSHVNSGCLPDLHLQGTVKG